MRAVIFDLDGTLSDPSHRLHHVKNGGKNWPAFFDEMGADPVHEPIRRLLWTLEDTNTILLVSGRPETHRRHTELWLAENEIPYKALHMRAAGDYRPDHIVKGQILDGLLADGYEIELVVDDRQSVVDMWRQRGLTCLQCRPDDSANQSKTYGSLTLMVGPSGAGKSTWLTGRVAKLDFEIAQDHIISSDRIRQELCGDFRDQTRNEEVFTVLRALVSARISHGLPAVVDATNIKRKDRLAITTLAPADSQVRYIVIDRHMERKRLTAGWRAELPIDLLAKHDQTFRSNLKDILAGDNMPNVKVFDERDLT